VRVDAGQALAAHAAEDKYVNLSGLCNRNAVVAFQETPLPHAARLMRERHVGSLIVVVERLGRRFPVGILTDRDIVVATVAQELDPHGLTAAEIMSRDPVTLPESASVADALAIMRERGIRRLPVLDDAGALAGIVTLDDLLSALGAEMLDFARVVEWQRVREACLRG
jgi:CBS domain-containing protein